MKKTLLSFCAIVLSFALISCSGYNNIMYKHLSDIENYIEVSGTLQEIYYWEDNEKIVLDERSDYSSLRSMTLFFDLQFLKEDYMMFCGCSQMSDDFDYSTNYIRLEMIPDNVQVLLENSFFNNVGAGDVITVTSSNFIYMDASFFEIIELKFEGITYLSLDVGIDNFTTYMEENHSIF